MWDLLKRSFGRSRTIFLNVISLTLMVFVELSDSLLNFDWDALFKHEVAVAIGLFMQVVNVIVRIDTNGPVNFGKLNDVPVSSVPPIVSVAPVDTIEEDRPVSTGV